MYLDKLGPGVGAVIANNFSGRSPAAGICTEPANPRSSRSNRVSIDARTPNKPGFHSHPSETPSIPR